LKKQVFHVETITLEKGDTLLLYTDGVTEAMDQDNKLYHKDRLVKYLKTGPDAVEPLALPAQQLPGEARGGMAAATEGIHDGLDAALVLGTGVGAEGDAHDFVVEGDEVLSMTAWFHVHHLLLSWFPTENQEILSPNPDAETDKPCGSAGSIPIRDRFL